MDRGAAMLRRLFALAALLLTVTGCVSAEVRERCPNWSMGCGCYCGPGGTWSGVGPPRPKPTPEEIREIVAEKMYPTKVPILDGQPLHPVTGKPFNCELMAPFEERLEERKKNPFTATFRYGMWWDHTFFEIRGWQGYAFGAHAGHIRQGIAMSRACRGLPSTTAPTTTSPAEAPDWCRGENQEWLGSACLTRGNP